MDGPICENRFFCAMFGDVFLCSITEPKLIKKLKKVILDFLVTVWMVELDLVVFESVYLDRLLGVVLTFGPLGTVVYVV